MRRGWAKVDSIGLVVRMPYNERSAREIARAKQRYPEACTVGIADGAASNWAFLDQHTERQLIDFFYASE